MDQLLIGKLICVECSKQFVHFIGGMPQEVCGVCAGVDSVEWED